MAHDIARDAYINRNYRLAADLYEQCLKERTPPTYEAYVGYGNSLAKCGQVRESLDVFSHCYRIAGGAVSEDKLRHLGAAFLDDVVATSVQRVGGGVGGRAKMASGLACAICEGVLDAPVTVDCGHTFCRKCLEKDSVQVCVLCGHRLSLTSTQLDTNIVVRGLVEKWWAAEVEAARRRDEGNEMFVGNDAEGALVKYDEAVAYAPQDHRILSNRSQALQCLNRMQESLADADSVVRLRPTWGYGHYQRGVLLCGVGRYDEALIALCVSAALDASTARVKTEVTHALHRLLVARTVRSRSRSPALTAGPYGRNAKPHAKATGYLAVPAVYSDNDSENDSCEDDSSQIMGTRWGACSASALQENTQLHSLLDCIYSEVEKAIRTKLDCKSNAELHINPQLVDLTDFDCILCCRTLWRPVTTPCGHTYCWSCLDRCLDYSSACPLCMTSLEMYLASSHRGVTDFIERALRVLLPGVYAERQASYCQDLLPSEQHIPIFVCTAAFPGVPCPLFVYEPRYRNMVRRCVQTGSRQFGMVACLGQAGGNRYAEYGTMQEIKDCLLMPDGSSIVTTLGRRRFRVVAQGERDGYDTAQVEFLRDDAIKVEQLPGLNQLHDRIYHKSYAWFHSNSSSIQGEIARVFGHMPALEDDWSANMDGPAWTWWLLAILPLGPRLQVGILATTNLEKRLRAIDKTLNHIQQSLPQLMVREPDEGSSSVMNQSHSNQGRDRSQRNQANVNPDTSQAGACGSLSSPQVQAQ